MSNTTPPGGYLVPPPPGASPERPGTVSMASALLWLLALLSVVSAALTIYTGTLMTKAKLLPIFTDAGYEKAEAEAAAAFTGVFTYLIGGLTLLFGVLYIVLAIFVGRGKQWARITAWVIAGLAICCGALNVLGTAGGSTFSGFGGQPGIDSEKLAKDMAALYPSWLDPASLVMGVVSLLAAILVVILLLLPPSHPYFRKPEPEWTPPTYPAP